MPKCEYCDFHHATPSYCSNCGRHDPCPSTHMLRLLGLIFGSIILATILVGIPALYIKHSHTVRDYPPAPPVPETTP